MELTGSGRKIGEMDRKYASMQVESLGYSQSIKERLEKHIAELEDKLCKAEKLKDIFDNNNEIASALDLLREVNVF